MADDVRIATGLRNHRKTKRLRRMLGAEGCWSLVCLFLWAGDERWTGDLSGLSDEDIEEEAAWEGEPGALVAALVEVRFLVGAEGGRSIHDWQEHNPYASTRGERVQKARKAAAARWSRRAGLNDATSMPGACGEHATRTDEQCPPTPTPTNTPVPTEQGAAAPADPIFGTGLAFLVRKGIPEAKARPFLGKLRKQAGDVQAAAILAVAEDQDVSDPIPWLSKAAVNARAGPQQTQSKTLSAIHMLEGMKHGLADTRNHDRLSEAPLFELGQDPGNGPDPRDRGRLGRGSDG